jgi:hypothetical protein
MRAPVSRSHPLSLLRWSGEEVLSREGHPPLKLVLEVARELNDQAQLTARSGPNVADDPGSELRIANHDTPCDLFGLRTTQRCR